MHTGTKIKELRKQHKLTQEELGEKLGVKKAAVQKYEKGEIVNLKLSTIKNLCELFEIKSDEIIFPDFNQVRIKNEVKLLEEVEEMYGEETVELMSIFNGLNQTGKNRAIETLYDFSQIEKYTKSSR